MILPSALRVDREDPSLRRIIEAWIEHEKLLRLLNPYGIIIYQDLDGLCPEGPIHIQAEVVKPNVPILAHLTGQLAEPEDPAQADGVHGTPFGLAQNHLRGQIVDPSLVIGPFVRPMAPELIILHELRMLAIHVRVCGAAYDVGIQHPALDGKAAFGEILPGMAACDGRPTDVELIEAGTERNKDLAMVTDHFLGSSPLDHRLVRDLDHLAEILPLDTSCSHDGPAVPVEDQNTVEPLVLDLDQIAHVDKPDLMGCGRLLGTFCGIGM